MTPQYSATLVEHFRHPRNYGALTAPEVAYEDVNPLCGDRIRIELHVSVEQTIAAYKGGGAEAFMTEIRAAIAKCPTESMAGGSKETNDFVASFPHLGDDSFAMQQTWTDMPEYSGQLMTYLAVVRLGDVVTTLYFVGWEDYSADLMVTTDYTRRAANAIRTALP